MLQMHEEERNGLRGIMDDPYHKLKIFQRRVREAKQKQD